jgi:Amt family ammonium transporter
VALVALYSFVVSLVLFKIIEKLVGVRVDVEQETEGIDISQHGETGYTI